ncbi:MAG: hypothetical protein HY916_00240 [Desulfovibrio sp.]|jgi:hypothetical protein|nr:hypothetical protein [Desulfovibrio sp.]
MLRLLPAPATEKMPPLRALPRPSAPAKGLVYTLLRHGQGLAHAECLRRMADLPPTDDGPFQAA